MLFFQTQGTGSSEQSNNLPQDVPQEVDLNPALALERLDSWLDGFVRLLPNIGVAIIVIILFYFLARGLKSVVINRANQQERHNLGQMLGSLLKATVIVVGFMLGMTIIIPSLRPGDLIAGLGVSSVAIGFAFKDILQNWLAGLLILIRQPFEIGDQIEVNGFEGTVQQIETRATIITTYGNQRIVIPNSEIYTNSVKVKTANELIRSQYDVGIGYGDDLKKACEVLKEGLKGTAGVSSEKEIEVLPWDLAASWVTLRVRWWTNSDRASVVKGKMNVIAVIKQLLDGEKIDMPYETQVHLFHDQTEADDGNREAQREGWPADGATMPKWQAEQEQKKAESDQEK